MRARTLIGILVFLLLALIFLVPSAQAQWAADRHVQVTVPFSFWVGSTLLPAGDYTLSHDRKTNGFNIVGKSGEGQTGIHVNHLELKTPAEKTELIFMRSGDKYVLHQVRIAGLKEVHDIRHDPNMADVEIITAD